MINPFSTGDITTLPKKKLQIDVASFFAVNFAITIAITTGQHQNEILHIQTECAWLAAAPEGHKPGARAKWRLKMSYQIF